MYRNLLSWPLEEMAQNDPAAAVPLLLDLIRELEAERHAYREVLEPIAYHGYPNPYAAKTTARLVCEEFVKPDTNPPTSQETP